MPDQKEILLFKAYQRLFTIIILTCWIIRKVIVHECARYNYHVHYALKANANDKILELIKSHGLGADCVSGNEIRKRQ
jgi:hypothetical protein